DGRALLGELGRLLARRIQIGGGLPDRRLLSERAIAGGDARLEVSPLGPERPEPRLQIGALLRVLPVGGGRGLGGAGLLLERRERRAGLGELGVEPGGFRSCRLECGAERERVAAAAAGL